MKNYRLRLTVLLVLAGLISASFFGAYGLTFNNSTPAPSKAAVKSTTITSVKPVIVPLPVPAPVPVAPAVSIPTVKETDLNLLVNGKSVDLAGTPIILATDGKTMLPLRKLGEALGYAVKWDDLIKAAVLQKNTETIIIKNNSLNYTWGSISRVFSKKPETVKNRLYVPLDFISGNTGYQLNQTTASVTIDLVGTVVKQVFTGEIEKITVFTNGLGLNVTDNKETSLLLYVTEKTKVTNYTTGVAADSSLLKVGTKAIFSYTEVPGDNEELYNVLSGVEVVDAAVKESEIDDAAD